MIEAQLECTFEASGSVELALCEKKYSPQESNVVLDTIHMSALPGMFRIVLIPRRRAEERKSTIREWWESGDAPFRGGVRFGDDQWDLRTVCGDISVAKIMFKDFFDHEGVSDNLLKSTYSVWDRNSWVDAIS